MTTAPTPTALPVPTQDQRTMALLVNVLAIFSSFLAPQIFNLVRRFAVRVALLAAGADLACRLRADFLCGHDHRDDFHVFYDRHAPAQCSGPGASIGLFRRIRVGLALGNGRMGLEPRSRNCLCDQGESGGMGAFPADWRLCAAQNFA